MTTNVYRDFTDRFADFWSAPTPGRMGEILTEDVTLIQPMSHPMVGLVAAQDEFRALYRWIPDLRAEVTHWAGQGGTLFISFTLTGTLGRNTKLYWPVVDRFELVGNKAVKRITYFDALPLLWTILKTPSAWWAWWCSGVARPWRR